jgi:tetratricopeptide (TPR) repeat protein
MGDTKQALTLANSAIKSGNQLHYVYLYAGDACRIAGRYKEAIAYYEKVATVPTDDNGHNKRNHERAKANIEAIKLFELSDVKQVADGSYRAESIGYEGPVRVEVAVNAQRIESVRVVQHKENSSIPPWPPLQDHRQTERWGGRCHQRRDHQRSDH